MFDKLAVRQYPVPCQAESFPGKIICSCVIKYIARFEENVGTWVELGEKV